MTQVKEPEHTDTPMMEHVSSSLDEVAIDPEMNVPVHQMFERWVRRTPQALAVTAETRSLNYSELNTQANQLAHYLRAQGVGPETPVALCVPRSIELVVGMLGILKAGGAYVPIDPATPPERLTFLLQDTGVSWVLTTRELADTFSSYHGQVIFLSDEDQAYAGERTDTPVEQVSGHNSAYIIYTSGSTGKPKGVQIEHHSLTNLVLWHQRAFAVSAHDRASQVAGINFDATGWEIWPYLTAGASIHFVDEETRITPEKLQRWLIAHHITIGFLPTPLMESVQHLPWPRISELRCLLTGGDRLHRFPSPGLPFEVVNNYGPTENTVVSTSTVLPAREATEEAPSIGLPIDNTTAYILDPWMNPVPVDVPGELYVGGVGLARGYLHRPDLTAERFIPDPLGSQAGSRLYRTGDLVRARLDGTIEFLERIDSQVKIRGFRIELGEIETSLSSHPDVGDVIVLAQGEAVDEKQLVAYLVPAHTTLATVSELRAYLRERLPSYMIPSDFIWLEQFPLTLNGKVDRRKLPASRHQMNEQMIAPRSETERALLAIWQDVMHIEQISVEADFFALGGYSLQATQIMARIRHAFADDVPLQQFFRAPTIADLAHYIEQHLRSLRQSFPIPMRGPGQDLAPLSFAQERLWFLHQVSPQSDAYNIPVAFHLCGLLDDEALAWSLNTIVERHEVLRSVFTTVDGVPMTRTLSLVSVPFARLDVRSSRSEERMERAMQLVCREACAPFDLARGPLLRALLIQLGEQEYIFLLNMHHCVTDGWSVDVMCRELDICYRAFVNGAEPDLPPLTIQYADYALWQRQLLQEARREEQLPYWKTQLQGASSRLPLARSTTCTMRGATCSLLLPRPLVQAVATIGKQQKATLFMALLAAFKMQLCVFTGQTDLVIGTPVASRTTIELEPLIGFFVNMLVLRTRMDGDPTYQDVLQQVRTTALEAYAHQDLPFELLVDALHLQRDIDRNPLFQVVFALQDAPNVAPSLENIVMEPLTIPLEDALFDLSVEVKEVVEGWVVSANYMADLFDGETIRQFLHNYEQLLHRITDNPALHLSELSPSLMFDVPLIDAVVLSPSASSIVERIAPRTPLEALLVAVWSEVLKRTDLSVQDNFFEIGGHSLLAAQLVSRLHDIFQAEFSVRMIFQAPTVADLAEELIRHEPFSGQFSMIAEIYQQVDVLSDDETLSALRQKRSEKN